MSVNLNIIGLSQSGRTSIFNALTKGSVDLTARNNAVNMGIAKVPDDRLNALRELFLPKKFTLAEVCYTETGSSVKTIEGNSLNQMAQSDALVAVVRAFNNDIVAHQNGKIDAVRDMEELFLEISFSDLGIIEKRLEKIASQMRGAKSIERGCLQEEEILIRRLQKNLEAGTPIRQTTLTTHEENLLNGYRFLSQKPLLVIINIDESDLPKARDIEVLFKEKFKGTGQNFIALCARLEAELAELPEEECAEMCRDFGISEPGLNRVIRESFALLNLISFFTAGTDEVRAWPILKGTNAQKAAGKIHTDIERGFIRAEVIYYQNLLEKKSIAEVKKAGLFRLEGKTYTVSDGDVINFLFNV